jgi:hypothetical protein
MICLADSSGGGIVPAVGWSLVIIALAVAGFVGVSKLRAWLKEEDDAASDASPIGFTLSDLKRLHREGKISTEEFEKAHSKMIGAAKAMAEKLPDPLAGSNRRRNERGGGPQGPPDAPQTP